MMVKICITGVKVATISPPLITGWVYTQRSLLLVSKGIGCERGNVTWGNLISRNRFYIRGHKVIGSDAIGIEDGLVNFCAVHFYLCFCVGVMNSDIHVSCRWVVVNGQKRYRYSGCLWCCGKQNLWSERLLIHPLLHLSHLYNPGRWRMVLVWRRRHRSELPL